MRFVRQYRTTTIRGKKNHYTRNYTRTIRGGVKAQMLRISLLTSQPSAFKTIVFARNLQQKLLRSIAFSMNSQPWMLHLFVFTMNLCQGVSETLCFSIDLQPWTLRSLLFAMSGQLRIVAFTRRLYNRTPGNN